LARQVKSDAADVEVQAFVHRLAQFLTSWQATTFLVGEYVEEEIRDNPLFTMVDGIFWLTQVTERNSVVRKLQIIKLRARRRFRACTLSASATWGCRPFRALWDWSAAKQSRHDAVISLLAYPNWIK